MKFDEFQYKVTVRHVPEMWTWCSNNCVTGTWGELIGFLGYSATMCFEDETDLLAFRLRFGV